MSIKDEMEYMEDGHCRPTTNTPIKQMDFYDHIMCRKTTLLNTPP